MLSGFTRCPEETEKRKMPRRREMGAARRPPVLVDPGRLISVFFRARFRCCGGRKWACDVGGIFGDSKFCKSLGSEFFFVSDENFGVDCGLATDFFGSFSLCSNVAVVGCESINLSTSTSAFSFFIFEGAVSALFNLFADVVSAAFPLRSCFDCFRWALGVFVCS